MRYGWILIQTNCDRGVDQHLTRQPAGLGSSNRTYRAEEIVLEEMYTDNTLPDFIFDGVRLSVSRNRISFVGKKHDN